MLVVDAIPGGGIAAAALDALPDGVLVVAEERVLFANRAACRMAGARSVELVGEPVPPAVLRLPAETAACELPNGLAGEVITVRDRAAQSAREARLQRLANRDGLTGLLNKRTFMRRLGEEAAVLAREGRPLGLVMVDLDHFKRVNDEHGHPAGDRVLREAAQRLARTARTVDSVGRFGGEEFAWLLPDSTPEETLAAAHRLADALRSRPFDGGLSLTASIGVCDLAAAGASPEGLVERADAALYWAKQLGRDAVLTWSEDAARRLARVRSASGPHEERLAALAALCDDGGHGRRVADLAFALAERLDWAPAQQARLHQAALLHDLGKAVLPAALLDRPGALGEAETAHLRQHPSLGAALADGVLDGEQRSWILGHHERPDGAGYPFGLGADELPLGAQLIGLADTWDAMVTDRNHHPAVAGDAALAEIDRCAGGQLLPGAGELLRDALAWWGAGVA